MTIETLRSFFGWCAVINMGLLLWWALFLWLGNDFVYRFHGRWYKLSVERFSAIHYTGMLYYKIGIFMFSIVPYLALRIIG